MANHDATGACAPDDTAPGTDEVPGIGEAFATLGQAGRDSVDSSRDMARAMRRLVTAEVAQARIVLGRAAVWLAVAVAFGASTWLLLMAALITALHALGLGWLAATSVSALVSLVIAAIGGWQAMRYFEMARFEATRKQLAHLSRRDDEDEEDSVRKPTLDQVQRRIERASQVMDGRRHQLRHNVHHVRDTWRSAWTPLRVLGAGLGLGFLSGRLEPEKAASGMAARLGAAPRILQMLSALSGLLAAGRAQAASEAAEHAGEAAEEAADQASAVAAAPGGLATATAAAAGVSPVVPPPRHLAQPPAAEAATELGDDDLRP